MSNVEILIFKVPGCPACMQYVPRMRRRHAPYAARVALHVIDVNQPQHQEISNYYGIHDVPVTVLRRKGQRNVLRYAGALTDGQIDWLLTTALNYS